MQTKEQNKRMNRILKIIQRSLFLDCILFSFFCFKKKEKSIKKIIKKSAKIAQTERTFVLAKKQCI